MKCSFKTYGLLFLYTLKISAFTFGGGYVIVSLMKKQFVDKLGWLNDDEMLDFTAIAQSSPGAVAVNASILVGNKIGGILGAVTAIIGTVLPPFVLLTAISYIYDIFISIKAIQYLFFGMQAGVIAVICDAVCGLFASVWKESRWLALAACAVAFVLVAFLSVNVILIVIAGIIYGILLYRRGEEKHHAA